MKILIVDDSPVIRKELKFFLSSGGHTDIILAESAREALGSLKREGCNNIGLILMDIMMPEIDGIEACRRIGAMECCNGIPIIMVTSESSTNKLQEAFDAGAMDYITKPVRKVELLARVASALRLKGETDKRKAHEEELVKLNELKNRFLGIAAHDLRNPLHAINLSCELVLRDLEQPKEQIKKAVNMINTATGRMKALVEDLLDISVIESGMLELQLRSGSLNKLLKERAYFLSIVAERKGISIHSELSDLPDFPFDSNRVSQVIDNLLSNAIKFSPTGSNIYLNLTQDGYRAVVSVKDEGPGVSTEDQNRLFVEFQRAGAQPTGGEKCTGLGLAIVKKIVNAHGGDVWVKSSPGAGATFGFTLPMET